MPRLFDDAAENVELCSHLLAVVERTEAAVEAELVPARVDPAKQDLDRRVVKRIAAVLRCRTARQERECRTDARSFGDVHQEVERVDRIVVVRPCVCSQPTSCQRRRPAASDVARARADDLGQRLPASEKGPVDVVRQPDGRAFPSRRQTRPHAP